MLILADVRPIHDDWKQFRGIEHRRATIQVSSDALRDERDHLDISYQTEIVQDVNQAQDVDREMVDRLCAAASIPYEHQYYLDAIPKMLGTTLEAPWHRAALLAGLGEERSGFVRNGLDTVEGAIAAAAEEIRVARDQAHFTYYARIPLTADLRRSVRKMGGRLSQLAQIELLDGERGRYQPLEHREELRVTADEDHLIVEGADAWEAAKRLVDHPYGLVRGRRIDRWVRPAAPAAGATTVALALLAAAFARFRLDTAWLLAYGSANALLVATAAWLAHRARMPLRRFALMISAPVIVIGFAVIYGSLMIGVHATITSPSPKRLSDPLLLSIGIGTTGGFLDYGIRGAGARWLALIEMMMLVTLAGGTIYSVTRQAMGYLRHLRPREGDQ